VNSLATVEPGASDPGPPERGTPTENPERLTPAETPERITPAEPPERLTPAEPPEGTPEHHQAGIKGLAQHRRR
jgi:hypothetical protein